MLQIPPEIRLRGSEARPMDTISGKLRPFLALADFEKTARRKLPRQIYGYYAGGSETEKGMKSNFDSFDDYGLVPRALVDVTSRSSKTTLFGRDYAMPVGIAPMGLSGLAAFEGDLLLARAAAVEGVLMVPSATSIMPLERICGEGRAHWFQCYLPGEAERIAAMLDRVERAGCDTVVLTVDVAVPANRENNVRTGFSMPLRPSANLLFQGLSHPRWSIGTFLRTLAAGMPHFENMDAFRGPPILSKNVGRRIGRRDALSWDHVKMMRRYWRGNLVIKGLLHPDDVAVAAKLGIDAAWISNHGGRQLDTAVAPMRMLPRIRDCAGAMKIFIDGGIRRGTDALKALALGADFAFIGRPFLFALAAAGEGGARHAIQLIKSEIDRDMALMGVTSLAGLNEDCLSRTCPVDRRLSPFARWSIKSQDTWSAADEV